MSDYFVSRVSAIHIPDGVKVESVLNNKLSMIKHFLINFDTKHFYKGAELKEIQKNIKNAPGIDLGDDYGFAPVIDWINSSDEEAEFIILNNTIKGKNKEEQIQKTFNDILFMIKESYSSFKDINIIYSNSIDEEMIKSFLENIRNTERLEEASDRFETEVRTFFVNADIDNPILYIYLTEYY